jgi:hypothetical protein
MILINKKEKTKERNLSKKIDKWKYFKPKIYILSKNEEKTKETKIQTTKTQTNKSERQTLRKNLNKNERHLKGETQQGKVEWPNILILTIIKFLPPNCFWNENEDNQNNRSM